MFPAQVHATEGDLICDSATSGASGAWWLLGDMDAQVATILGVSASYV